MPPAARRDLQALGRRRAGDETDQEARAVHQYRDLESATEQAGPALSSLASPAGGGNDEEEPQEEAEEEEDAVCRICGGDEQPELLIMPCNCAHAVHTTCLQRWIDSRPARDVEEDDVAPRRAAASHQALFRAAFYPASTDRRAVCEVCACPYTLRHRYVFALDRKRLLAPAGVAAAADVVALSALLLASPLAIIALVWGCDQHFARGGGGAHSDAAVFAFASPLADAVILGVSAVVLAALCAHALPRAVARWRVVNSRVAIAGGRAHQDSAGDDGGDARRGLAGTDLLALRPVSSAAASAAAVSASAAEQQRRREQWAQKEVSAERARAAAAAEAAAAAAAQAAAAAAEAEAVAELKGADADVVLLG